MTGASELAGHEGGLAGEQGGLHMDEVEDGGEEQLVG